MGGNDPPSRGRHGETSERISKSECLMAPSEPAFAAGSFGVAAAETAALRGGKQAAGKPPEPADKNVCPTARGCIEFSENGLAAGLAGVAAADPADTAAPCILLRPAYGGHGGIVQVCSLLFTSARIFGKILHGSASEPTPCPLPAGWGYKKPRYG
jgi:hypothetical protein